MTPFDLSQHLLDTLQSIAMQQIKPDTDRAEVLSLVMGAARIAVDLAEANGMQAWKDGRA